jgi:hypothetical protein
MRSARSTSTEPSFGQQRMLSQRIESVPAEETARRAAAFLDQSD